MNRNFSDWINTFRESISDYKYYVDFPKVYKNVENVKVELNILNSLIGSKNIKRDFEILISRYPEVLPCIPILLAVRSREVYCQENGYGEWYYFDKISTATQVDSKKYAVFMEKTGLFDLLSHHVIHNLIDYVTGVETGLDSNGRKNRGGHLMENLVENFIQKAGFLKNVDYFKEMYIHEVQEKWNVDLSAISNQGKSEKRFDFVVYTEKMIYGIETNFYRSGGSKLNETARSYKTIAWESQNIKGFTFVWVTDGFGWKSARNNLEETFDVMEHVYNIHDLEQGIFCEVFR